MNITEVRVKLMDGAQDRLLAFCSITLEDAFVIRDLKIIQGESGPFVAMPSRKLTERCPRCSNRNGLRANFCEQCGAQLRPARRPPTQGRFKLYADIAHPINAQCRQDMERVILTAFGEEISASEKPGYVCRYEDYGEDSYAQDTAPQQEDRLKIGSSAQQKA